MCTVYTSALFFPQSNWYLCIWKVSISSLVYRCCGTHLGGVSSLSRVLAGRHQAPRRRNRPQAIRSCVVLVSCLRRFVLASASPWVRATYMSRLVLHWCAHTVCLCAGFWCRAFTGRHAPTYEHAQCEKYLVCPTFIPCVGVRWSMHEYAFVNAWIRLCGVCLYTLVSLVIEMLVCVCVCVCVCVLE
jgi:hypothetical protein